MEKKKIDPRAVYHAKPLRADGSYDYSKVNKLVPQKVGNSTMTADQKLRQMLQRELERMRAPDESFMDYYDFDVPNDQAPELHRAVDTDVVSGSYIRKVYTDGKKWKQEQKSKQTDDGDSISRKSAKTDRAERVDHDKNKPKSASSKNSAAGADEEGN